LNEITPGILVNAEVTDVYNNGIGVKFLGFFVGSIELRHLGNKACSGKKDIDQLFSKSKKVIYPLLLFNTFLLIEWLIYFFKK